MNSSIVIKSTLDKVLSDLAITLSIPYVDWDNLSTQARLRSTTESTLIGKFDVGISSSPYVVEGTIRAGGKVSEDAGNYELLAMLDAIKARFSPLGYIRLRDYTGETPSLVKGNLNIKRVVDEENQTDSGVNVRFVLIEYVAVLFDT